MTDNQVARSAEFACKDVAINYKTVSVMPQSCLGLVGRRVLLSDPADATFHKVFFVTSSRVQDQRCSIANGVFRECNDFRLGYDVKLPHARWS